MNIFPIPRGGDLNYLKRSCVMFADDVVDDRGGGLYSGRQYAFVSTGDSGLIY